MAEIPNPETSNTEKTEVIAETPTTKVVAEIAAKTPNTKSEVEIAPETSTVKPAVEIPAQTSTSKPPATVIAPTVTPEQSATAESQTPAANPFQTIANVEITTPNQPEKPVIVAKMSTSNSPETVSIAEDTVTDKSPSQSQQIKEQVFSFISNLPDYINEFYQQYRSPITVVGLIVASVITLKVFLGVVDALNDIPLLEPTFELIGIGYSVWFIYRYLLKSSNRQELSQNIQVLKEQVLGRKS
ncbi:hypothetical protein BCD67_01150 [Oscillatoriales cyanobacterium USR001]|nr:hypothetical protein BCD67_01150 [Oscillatoriales cyanobacterium USR001]